MGKGEGNAGKLRGEILERLKEVQDPELKMDVVSLGLIREVSVDEEGKVSIVFRPTSPLCPLAFKIALDIREAAEKVEGVRKVDVEAVDFLWANQLREFLKGKG
ncbi:MAG: metal-sulfur cluster assembly factor [Candidatus Latescibacterota bacterium]|nr:MAG: metal-sulfur cluster assembly factor [Candidatus Latescibacterota bacterium]